MAWLSVFVSLLTLLAVCRITRLITEDTITQPIRAWVHKRAHPAPLSSHKPGRSAGRPDGRDDGRSAALPWRWADKLITCPWCSGFWVSAALTLAYYRCWLGYWPHDALTGFSYAVATFACSWVSALLADWLDAPPPPKQVILGGSLHTTTPPTP